MSTFDWLCHLPLNLLLCNPYQTFLCTVLSLKTSNQNSIKFYCFHKIFRPIDLSEEQFHFSEYTWQSLGRWFFGCLSWFERVEGSTTNIPQYKEEACGCVALPHRTWMFIPCLLFSSWTLVLSQILQEKIQNLEDKLQEPRFCTR